MQHYKVILEDEKGLKFKEHRNGKSIIDVIKEVNDDYYNIKNMQVFCVGRSFDVIFEYCKLADDEIFKDMHENVLCARLNEILLYKKHSLFLPNLKCPISIVINGERYISSSIEQICNIMNKYNLKRKESYR